MVFKEFWTGRGFCKGFFSEDRNFCGFFHRSCFGQDFFKVLWFFHRTLVFMEFCTGRGFCVFFPKDLEIVLFFHRTWIFYGIFPGTYNFKEFLKGCFTWLLKELDFLGGFHRKWVFKGFFSIPWSLKDFFRRTCFFERIYFHDKDF